MSSKFIGRWLVMILLGISLIIVPILYVGITSERMLVWFTAIIGGKWLLFGIIEFYTSTEKGMDILKSYKEVREEINNN